MVVISTNESHYFTFVCGPGDHSRHGNSLRAGRIESRWRRDIPQPSRPALGTTHPPLDGYRVSFPGVTRPERGVDHLPPNSAEIKE
jgi:hypothetical protein